MENPGEEEVMADELYQAAVNGDNDVITSESDEYLLMETHQNDNIVHIAIRNKRYIFADAALTKFPQLLCEENTDGNNPLHIAAEVGDIYFVRPHCDQLTDMLPLRMKNSDGNTPLHVAILHGNLEIARYFVEKEPRLARIRNDCMEAPLHLLIKHYVDADQNDGRNQDWEMGYSFIELLLNTEPSVACSHDACGSTPLLTAAGLCTDYVFKIIKLILLKSPPSMEICDNDGKTILHHLIDRIPSLKQGTELFTETPGLQSLKHFQDQQGNTPLHLAAINKDYIMVKLLEVTEEDLSIENRDGRSIGTLMENKTLDRWTKAWRRRRPWAADYAYSAKMGGLYIAVQNGDREFFPDKYFLSKSENRDSVLHMAIRYNQYHFAKQALKIYPKLMMDGNADGNTPLHVAAQIGNPIFVGKLCNEQRDPVLLRMQNSLGNTALHVALIYNNLRTAKVLMEKDPELIDFHNGLGETPLHLVLHNYCDGIEVLKENVIRIISRVSRYDDVHDEDDFGSSSNDPTSSKRIKEEFEDDKEVKKFKDDEEVKEFKDDEEVKGYSSDYEKAIRMTTREFKDDEENSGQTSDHPTASKMVLMIDLMLTLRCPYAFKRDFSGLTPLHKAALLDTSYNLDIIQLIIFHCPQSVEVCDGSGKTILHHLINRIKNYDDGKKFLEKSPEIRVLTNHQDREGNTPLHMALIEKDMIMFQLLTHCYTANRFIKNNAGLCPTTLIRQSNIKGDEEIMMTNEESDAADHGDVILFNRRPETGKTISRKDSTGRNLLHRLFSIDRRRLIIPDLLVDFIKRFKGVGDLWDSNIMLQTDHNGDTPFHILARLEPHNIKINVAIRPPSEETMSLEQQQRHILLFYNKIRSLSLLYKGYYGHPYNMHHYDFLKYLENTSLLKDIMEIFDEFDFEDTLQVPWVMQNEKGNTPLHEAIIARNYQVLPKLARFSRDNAAVVNNRKETVCHLLASLTPYDIVINNTSDSHHHKDVDGLSPLIRAIRAGNIKFPELLCKYCPDLAKVPDPEGQTFWHLLARLPQASSDLIGGSLKKKEVWSQLATKDNNEDTPLHLALRLLHFDLAKGFMEYDGYKFKKPLLEIPNREGETPGDMIGAFPYLPHKFDDFIWKGCTMIGTRSIWGISTTQITGYVNTMGVIAALLTTITFTAAFTVPGGLDQSKGTPLLINNTAFQIFITSDVLAMYLSMMVLICLLWIMATGNKSKSVVLLDFSIILLLASFYTTLLTFITGLYATTHLVKPWVAKVSIALCSMLFLLIHQYLVIKVVIPSGKAILVSYHYVSEALKIPIKWCTTSVCYKRYICPRSSSLESHQPMPSPGLDLAIGSIGSDSPRTPQLMPSPGSQQPMPSSGPQQPPIVSETDSVLLDIPIEENRTN